MPGRIACVCLTDCTFFCPYLLVHSKPCTVWGLVGRCVPVCLPVIYLPREIVPALPALPLFVAFSDHTSAAEGLDPLYSPSPWVDTCESQYTMCHIKSDNFQYVKHIKCDPGHAHQTQTDDRLWPFTFLPLCIYPFIAPIIVDGPNFLPYTDS